MAYKLPATIYNRTQLRQLQRGLEQLKPASLAKMTASGKLQELLAANNLRQLDATSLGALTSFVKSTLQTAPQLSITLASLPTADERSELVDWLRNQLAPNLLVHFMENDDLLAGCVVRTPRTVYDWSLRQALGANQDKLIRAWHHV